MVTKEDHARVRQYRDRIRQRIEAGEQVGEQLGKAVAQQMAAEGSPLPAEVASAAGWSS